MNRIAFDFGHPSHYLVFRNVLMNHKKLGFEPFIIIQNKDVLKKMLIKDGFNFYTRFNKGTTISRSFLLPKDIIQVRNLYKKNNIIANFGGASIVGSWASFFLKKHSIVVDDSDTAKEQRMLYSFPSTKIWTSHSYRFDFGKKHRTFKGIFPFAYLDSKIFKPDFSIAKNLGLLERGKPILIRIIENQASHDWKFRKLRDNFYSIIDKLEKDYDIIISIENEHIIPHKYQKYVKKFDPLDYHHIIASSKLYIGSGASTAQEASALGIPSIYTNQIKPGYIHWLENEFNLIKSIKSQYLTYEDVENILSKDNKKWENAHKNLINQSEYLPGIFEKMIKKELTTS